MVVVTVVVMAVVTVVVMVVVAIVREQQFNVADTRPQQALDAPVTTWSTDWKMVLSTKTSV